MSKHGFGLLTGEAVVALRARILPLATLVTPNLPEAAALSGLEVEGRDDMRRAADAILAAGARAVLVKGGHLQDGGENAAADLFVDPEVEEWLIEPRIATPHTHGTGCTLSAAIAAHLARSRPYAPARRSSRRRSATRWRWVTGSGRSTSCGRSRGRVCPERARRTVRWARSQRGMRVTLPALMHEVQA
jgi:hydroxymethylpyrimidine kinase/phosphomethylpyrimidine kinase